jgi:hypothetical protein
MGLQLPQIWGSLTMQAKEHYRMCNNATKQEILVLTVLSKSAEPLSENQLIKQVGDLAAEVFSQRYLDHLPMPLHEVCKNLAGSPLKCARRLRTRFWTGTENTEKQLRYLIDVHAPKDLRQRLQREVVTHAA